MSSQLGKNEFLNYKMTLKISFKVPDDVCYQVEVGGAHEVVNYQAEVGGAHEVQVEVGGAHDEVIDVHLVVVYKLH